MLLMPKISKEKKERIQEHIISFLYSSFPKQIFTSDISQELARDEEFIKKLLLDLEKKQLVTRVSKNSKGNQYIRRIRWRISNKAYDIYKKSQDTHSKTQAITKKNVFQ
jgi:predicted transcriptional regulator with HTH domain